MAWFYATDTGRQGPVTETEFTSLVQSGTITPTMLIWQEGMPDWQPLSQARPELLGATTTGADPAPVPQVGGVAVNNEEKDAIIQRMREGVSQSNAIGYVAYGGFWWRFLAIFIDGIILNIVLTPLQLIAQAPMMALENTDAPEVAAPAAFGFLGLSLAASFLVPFLYRGFMIGKWGATLGKMACGLRVVTPDGAPVSMGRAFGRAGAEIISGLTCSIGYLIAAFDDEKRALHDHIASTRVVKIR